MAVLCKDIITRAMQKAKIAARDEVTNEEYEDALEELRSLYEQWAAGGMFGKLADVATSTDYEASAGQRIRVTDGATITLPVTVEEDGADYPQYELSLIEIVDVEGEEVTRYLYSEGTWISINDLALTDAAPLAGRGRAGLAACLALQLEEFGGVITAGVARQAASFRMGLALKYGADSARTAPEYY